MRTYIEFVLGVFVVGSPWARLPNSFLKAHDQVSRRSGSLRRMWYLEMALPVVGWMTGAQKCSMFGCVVLVVVSAAMV